MSDELSPEEIANEALAEATKRLEDLDDASAGFEAGKIEDDAVQTVIDGVARALVGGLNKPAGFFAGVVAEECTYYNKTDIKAEISDRVEELKAARAGKERLDDYLHNELESVTIHRSTDAKQGAQYTWEFSGFKLQTEGGKESRGHYDWTHLRDAIHESGGPNLAKPEKDRRSGDDWRDFVANLIDERGETRRIIGPRTQAVEKIQNRIKRQTGYGTPEAALEYTGIWVRRDEFQIPDWWPPGQSFSYDRDTLQLPDWWTEFAQPPGRKSECYPPEWYGNTQMRFPAPGEARDIETDTIAEIRVHDSIIQQVIEDAEITRSALYQELSARGHTVPGSGGPSTREYVDGTEQRFWTLLASIGTPRVYVPNPHARDTTPVTADSESEASEPPEDAGGFEGVGETA